MTQEKSRPVRSVKVTKRPVITCSMCSAPSEFTVAYNDPANPGPEGYFGRTVYRTSTISKQACKQHVEAVNYTVLVEAGLAGQAAPPEGTNAE